MSEETTLQKIAGAIGTYAPGIAALLVSSGVGAPAAAAVAAIGALAKQFGLPDNASHDDVLAAIQTADPETKLKIIAAENAFQLTRRDQDIKELQAQLADVQSARQRQVEHEKATGKSDLNLYVLAWVIMGGFIGSIIGLIIMAAVFPEVDLNNPLLNILFGSLSTDAGMVVGYFFGSSRSSEVKTGLLAKAQPITK